MNKEIRILVVDDDPAVLEVTVEMVKEVLRQQSLGANIDATNGLAPALELFNQENHTIVFSDLMMEGPIDGLRLLQGVKLNRPETFFVLFSGGILPKELAHYTRMGANWVVAKPFYLEDILEAIRRFQESMIPT